MCYTLISYGEVNKEIFLHSLPQTNSNKDGFAVRSGETIIRTLNKSSFISKALKIDFKNALHLHYRLSTNVVKEEYVHLWNKSGDFTFAHNGVISNIEHENDSLGFLLENYDAILNKDLKAIKTASEKINGYAVITINYKDESSIFISCNKSLKIQKVIGSDAIIFASDFLDLNEKESYITSKEVKYNGFTFFENKATRVRGFDSLHIEKENCIILVNENGELVKEIEITPSLNFYNYGYNYRENNYNRYYKRYSKKEKENDLLDY